MDSYAQRLFCADIVKIPLVIMGILPMEIMYLTGFGLQGFENLTQIIINTGAAIL